MHTQAQRVLPTRDGDALLARHAALRVRQRACGVSSAGRAGGRGGAEDIPPDPPREEEEEGEEEEEAAAHSLGSRQPAPEAVAGPAPGQGGEEACESAPAAAR